MSLPDSQHYEWTQLLNSIYDIISSTTLNALNHIWSHKQAQACWVLGQET